MRTGSSLRRPGTGPAAICGMLLLAAILPCTLLAQSDAKALYDSKCASCHGAGGAGDGAMAKAMKATVPSFADADFQASRTDEQFVASVTTGKAPMMPGFGSQLKPEQIKDLVAYIRQFGKSPSN